MHPRTLRNTSLGAVGCVAIGETSTTARDAASTTGGEAPRPGPLHRSSMTGRSARRSAASIGLVAVAAFMTVAAGCVSADIAESCVEEDCGNGAITDDVAETEPDVPKTPAPHFMAGIAHAIRITLTC